MVTTYAITVSNQCNEPRAFLLSFSPFNNSTPLSNATNPIYQQSPILESGPHSQTTFSLTNEYFAVYGTMSTTQVGNVHVTSSNSMGPVTLGPNGTYAKLATINGDGVDPAWDTTPSAGVEPKTTAAPGAFTIETDQYLKPGNPNNIYIGLGARDPTNPNRVVPVTTFAAEPQTKNIITPVPKYYVCAYYHGESATMVETSMSDGLAVDFSGAKGSNPQASFVYNKDGKFVPADDSMTANGVKWTFGQDHN
ncbi:hypothetical protein B0H63DRAFT_459431 [Podospora didyma]|uniref:Uncharacterized protein n=1 Tax=Podospora didyma TaxID=330526 RepID=A0AAE0P5W6_9PEZI|nr:hypothetical protein B0H63DRAFT_459431 [Podospora didyma]